MKKLITICAVLIVMLLISEIANASTVNFTAADVISAIEAEGDALSNLTNQWGLWAVRARPIVSGGGYTITGASTSQTGWGTTAPSSYNWNTYGTNCAWFWDASGSEAKYASNPLYMIMDVSQDNFESYSFNAAGNCIGSYSPGGGGTFYASGYDGGIGGTNLVTAASNSSSFSFSFTLDSGAIWGGQWEFLVDGSKYSLGTYSSPGVWSEDFFGDYGAGGGLTNNMGNGYQVVPEPATILLLGLGSLLFARKKRK